MRKYHLKISGKTRFLNQIRRLFMIPSLEKMLAEKTVRHPRSIYRKFIPPDYLYPNGSIRKVSREGINYTLDISNVVEHYIYFGIIDADFTPVLDEIRSAETIFDIGGNIASKSMYFASQNPGSKIFTFEPHPDTFKKAMSNLDSNNFENISPFNFGLGEKEEKVRLYEVNENNPGMNRILNEEIDLPYKEISIQRLDDFVESKSINSIDFIKIDVEGFEYSVLNGGRNSISRFKPLIFMELDDNNLRANGKSAVMILELLKSMGYTSFQKADNKQAVDVDYNFENCHFDLIARK